MQASNVTSWEVFPGWKNTLSCFLSAAPAQMLLLSGVSGQNAMPRLVSSYINPRKAPYAHYAHRKGHLGKMRLPDHPEVKELANTTKYESAETKIRASL